MIGRGDLAGLPSTALRPRKTRLYSQYDTVASQGPYGGQPGHVRRAPRTRTEGIPLGGAKILTRLYRCCGCALVVVFAGVTFQSGGCCPSRCWTKKSNRLRSP